MGEVIAIVLAVVAIVGVLVMLRQQRLMRKRLKEAQRKLEIENERRLDRWRDENSRALHAMFTQQSRQTRYELEWKSDSGEDCFIWMALGRPTLGSFVEVGAHDGYFRANTYALEAMGWTGVLIEPIPEAFEKCKARRPGSKVVRAACSRKGSKGTTTFTMVAGSGADEQLSFITDSGGGGPHRQPLKKRAKLLTQIEVPLTTMDEVLSPYVQRLDLAVIDVEGGEADLLDGFSLDKFKPRIILIEDRSPPPNSEPRVLKILADAGYVYVTRMGLNNLFVHKDEHDVLREAKRLAKIF
jgi:FkbM family methyltransferase